MYTIAVIYWVMPNPVLNDESRNLITGTVQMNQDVMTLFEADILRYVRQSGNHVIYRVTPDFRGQNLVCNGFEFRRPGR